MLNVLIIDDSPDYCALLKRMIESAHDETTIEQLNINSLEDTAVSPDWSRYDVLFLDYQIGNTNGLEWLKSHQSTPNFPATIFLTGSSDSHLPEAAFRYGVVDFLRKMETTPATIKTAIERAQASYFMCSDDSELVYLDDAGSGQDIPTFGGYRLKRTLGKGGFSVVHLAEDKNGHEVAIKVIRVSHDVTESSLTRFLEEHRLLMKINHPSIIRVLDIGGDDHTAFSVMEYMPGGDLKSRLHDKISVLDATRYVRQITQGLSILHKQGIIHRDIKPNNILFRADGSLAIADLGIAKADDRNFNMTGEQEVIGTPLYLSPEQIRGKTITPASDLYALGIIFYQMLSGAHPFTKNAASIVDILTQHCYKEASDIPSIPKRLNNLILKMIAKNPANRYSSTDQLLSDISDVEITLAH